MQPAKAGGKRLCRSAKPQLSRQCRERKKPPRFYDIAGNITKSNDFWIIFAAFRIANHWGIGLGRRLLDVAALFFISL
jgi:hypothetical protein